MTATLRNDSGSGVNIGSGFGICFTPKGGVYGLYMPFSQCLRMSEQLTCIVRLCLFRRLPHRTGRIYHHGTRNRNTSFD